MNPTRIVIALPFPPSINHYYIRGRFGVVLGEKGRQFRKEAIYLCGRQVPKEFRFGPQKRLYVSIAAFPPDRRRRDVDNYCKGIFDSLTHAKVFDDDSQIDHLEVIRKAVQPGAGRVIVTIEEIS